MLEKQELRAHRLGVGLTCLVRTWLQIDDQKLLDDASRFTVQKDSSV